MAASSRPSETDAAPRRATIGDLLRETRLSYGGQIDQIATTLRIRASYLTAIEESRYDRLPAQVYALGFVRAYANHLGLDAEEAVRRFKQETASFEAPRTGLSFPMPLAERSVPGGTMLLAALILAFCGYGLWYYVSTGERARPERVSVVPPDLQSPPPAAAVPVPPPAATTTEAAPAAAPTLAAPAQAPVVSATPAPSLAPPPSPSPPVASSSPPPLAGPSSPVAAAPLVAAPSPSPSASAAPGVASSPATAPPPSSAEIAALTAPTSPAAGTSAPATTAAPPSHVFGAAVGEPSRILLVAKKDCWIQVRDTDYHIIAERILHAGDSYRVPDRRGLILRTGNGSGLDIAVDGKPAPSLGGTVHHNVALDPVRLMAGTAISED